MSSHLCSDFCCSPMSWYLPGLQPSTVRVWAANFYSWYLTAVTDVPGSMLKLLLFESLLFFTSAKCPLLDFSLNFLDLLPIPISDTSSFGIQIFSLFTYTLILLKKKKKVKEILFKVKWGSHERRALTHTSIPFIAACVTSKKRRNIKRILIREDIFYMGIPSPT